MDNVRRGGFYFVGGDTERVEGRGSSNSFTMVQSCNDTRKVVRLYLFPDPELTIIFFLHCSEITRESQKMHNFLSH